MVIRIFGLNQTVGSGSLNRIPAVSSALPLTAIMVFFVSELIGGFGIAIVVPRGP